MIDAGEHRVCSLAFLLQSALCSQFTVDGVSVSVSARI